MINGRQAAGRLERETTANSQKEKEGARKKHFTLQICKEKHRKTPKLGWCSEKWGKKSKHNNK